MTYYDERQLKMSDKINKKLEEFPEYMYSFFHFKRSKITSNVAISCIGIFLKWLIENKKISKEKISDIEIEDFESVTIDTMLQYFEWLRLQNSEETVRSKIICIRKFWNYLVRRGVSSHIDNQDFKDLLSKYKQSPTEVIVPEKEDLDKFLNNLYARKSNFGTFRDITIVELFLGSGIRLSELIGLNVDDIDFDNHTLRITAKGNINREVKITDRAEKYLEDYLQRRDVEKSNTNALFLSNRGERMSATAIQSFFKKYSDGVLHPHLLRHYVASVMANDERGGYLQAKEQLGHRSVKTTESYYIKIDRDRVRNSLNNVWNG